ncbi:MAG: phosphoribosylglycinamide formyltransferase [Pseudomonadota bacterium]
MTPRVAIFISGGGSNMVALVEDMQAKGYAIPALVLSNKAMASGLIKAQKLGVPTAVVPHQTYDSREAFEDAVQAELDAAKIDRICLAGFMRVLTEGFIRKWEGRMINIHPSLLPKYKGLHTHQRAIDAGDTEAGCSVHLVTAELDGGPVLGQARVPILAEDTADSLAARVLPEEHKLYPKVLQDWIRG